MSGGVKRPNPLKEKIFVHGDFSASLRMYFALFRVAPQRRKLARYRRRREPLSQESHSDSQTMSTLSGSIPGMGTVSCLFGNIAPAVSQPFEPGTRDLQFG